MQLATLSPSHNLFLRIHVSGIFIAQLPLFVLAFIEYWPLSSLGLGQGASQAISMASLGLTNPTSVIPLWYLLWHEHYATARG